MKWFNYYMSMALALVLVSNDSYAQQLPVLNHYIYSPNLYNPARTGHGEMGTLSAHFKKQWVNMPYSPITGILNVDAPIKNTNMGVGGMIYSDQMHIIDKFGALASYAYHIPLNKEKTHRLSAGLSLGVIYQRFDFLTANVANQADLSILLDRTSGAAIDFSAGLNYQLKGLNIGFAMLQGLNNGLKFRNSDGQDVNYINTRHYIGTASYRFKLGAAKKLYLEPVALVRALQGVPIQAEGNVLLGWKNIGWIGAGYRSSNLETSTAAIMVTAGVEIKDRFVAAYTFEIGADGQLNQSMGSQHEFTLMYRLGRTKAEEELLKSLSEDIEQLKKQDSIHTNTINNLTDTIEILDERLGEQEEGVGQMRERINEQDKLIKEYEESIINNTEEIEKLKEMMGKGSLGYKKIGEVLFDMNSAELKGAGPSQLDAIKQFWDGRDQSKKIIIYLLGNASVEGSESSNLELSKKRTIAVRQYLVKAGIPGEKVIILPIGEANPMEADNSNVDTKDRRVDIIVSEE